MAAGEVTTHLAESNGSLSLLWGHLRAAKDWDQLRNPMLVSIMGLPLPLHCPMFIGDFGESGYASAAMHKLFVPFSLQFYSTERNSESHVISEKKLS